MENSKILYASHIHFGSTQHLFPCVITLLRHWLTMAATNCNNNNNANTVLGHGTYGKVYKHFSNKLNLFVARKVFTRKKDFEDETSWLTLVKTSGSHPNVVHLVDSHNDPSHRKYYVDLELGLFTLYDLAFDDKGAPRKRPSLQTAALVRDMVANCLKGLSFLHTKVHIAHNDIKPNNILVFPNNVYKICDLGMCSFLSQEKFFGTFGYVAPELYMGEETPDMSGKHDVFSMGISLYEVLEGHLPTPCPSRLSEAYRRYNQKRGKSREELKARFILMVAEFYEDEYQNVLMNGTNVNTVGYGVIHLLADMCNKSVELRPTADKCMNRLRLLEQVERNLTEGFKTTERFSRLSTLNTRAVSARFKDAAALSSAIEISGDSPSSPKEPVVFAVPQVPLATPFATLAQPSTSQATLAQPTAPQAALAPVLGQPARLATLAEPTAPSDPPAQPPAQPPTNLFDILNEVVRIPDLSSFSEPSTSNHNESTGLEIRFPANCRLKDTDKKTIKELLEIAVAVAHTPGSEVPEENLTEPQKAAIRTLRMYKPDTQEIGTMAFELLQLVMFNKVFKHNCFSVFHALTLKSIWWWKDSPVAKRMRKLSRDSSTNA